MTTTDFDEDEFEVPDDEQETPLEPDLLPEVPDDEDAPEPSGLTALAAGGSTAAIDDEWVVLKYPHVARGQLANSLLAAADELDLGPTVVKSQTDGFKVPIELARYLWPTEFGGEK